MTRKRRIWTKPVRITVAENEGEIATMLGDILDRHAEREAIAEYCERDSRRRPARIKGGEGE